MSLWPYVLVVAEESRRVVGGLDLDQAIVVGSVRGECSTPSELLNQKSSELLFKVEAATAPIACCSEVGPVHYDQSTLGQVLSPREPCAEDEVGSISLQAAVELGASSSSMLIMLSNCTGEADQFDRLGAVR